MLIFAVAALVGMATGLVLGGRLSALAGLRLRAPILVWAALGVQVGLGLAPLRSLPDGARFGLVIASYGLVGVWLALNAVSHGTVLRLALGLLAAGWLLNLVVMVPNAGMPVSAAALRDSGAPPGLDVEEGHLWKHVELSPSTVLPALGDVVAVPVLRSAVSAGDIIMVVGLASTVAVGMVRGGASPRPPELPRPLPAGCGRVMARPVGSKHHVLPVAPPRTTAGPGAKAGPLHRLRGRRPSPRTRRPQGGVAPGLPRYL